MGNSPKKRPKSNGARYTAHRYRRKKHIVLGNLCTSHVWIGESKCHRRRRVRKKVFEGACIDTGAQRCVIGKPQATAYTLQHRVQLKLNPSRTVFRFGDGEFSSLGTMPIRLPTPDGSTINMRADVVRADIPLLLGLDLLDKERLMPNNVLNLLQHHDHCCSISVTRKFGHMYVCWSSKEVLFTRSELLKLHRHFRHPSQSKLWALIKRARPDHADEETRQLSAFVLRFRRRRWRLTARLPSILCG